MDSYLFEDKINRKVIDEYKKEDYRIKDKFTWHKNKFFRNPSCSKFSFANPISSFTPLDTDNLRMEFSPDCDFSGIPTLEHGLDQLIENTGILTMKELHRMKYV